MSALRDKLLALADATPTGFDTYNDHVDISDAILAAARMALDDAARVCDEASEESHAVQSYGPAIGERDCAHAIRALAARLGDER